MIGACSAAAIAAATATVDPGSTPAREPFRLVNTASFTASCTLLSNGYPYAAIALDPGESYAHTFPPKRTLQLVCLKARTRDTPLAPGRSYKLIEVNGHLEIGG